MTTIRLWLGQLLCLLLGHPVKHRVDLFKDEIGREVYNVVPVWMRTRFFCGRCGRPLP